MHDFDDCNEVLRNVYAFHDQELSADEADDIRAHLMACEPCLDSFQVEEAMRVLVRRCCSGQKAPQDLRMRIHLEYSHTVVVETSE